MSKSARRCTCALAALVALFLCAAPSALAAPTADFTVSAQPQAGTPVTFTSTSTTPALTTITAYAWDFDGNGTVDSTLENPTHTFARGTFNVTLTVTNSEPVGNTDSVTKPVTANGKPMAAFTFNPANPLPDQPVLFASNASDPDNNNLAHTWDFGDGSGPVTERNPAHAYTTPGEKTVRLVVSDGNGGLDEATGTVTVRDPSAAAASFDFTPGSPVAGQVVTFTSTSTPSAGQSISSQKWDLDSDGSYDDASGGTATRRFDSAGVYRVALQVTQANGNDAVAEGTVRVGTIEQSPPPGQTPNTPGTGNPKAKPSLMSPFPFVRLRAAAYRRYTSVQVLSVRGPRGSVVKVRCKGKGCPKVTRRKHPKGHSVRFKTFERRIRVGASLQIFVVAKGRIGKYASFKMRSSKPALRVDRCLVPGKKKPRPCPS